MKKCSVIPVLILAASQAAIMCFAQADKQDQQADRNFIVSLTDGTSLVCKPVLKALPVKTSYADMEIPLDRLASAVFDREKKEVTIKVANGDQLKGTVALENLKLQTAIGEITVSMAFVEQIASKTTAPIKAAMKIEDTPARRSRCINHLRMLDSAKEQWALANRASDGSPVHDVPGMLQYVKGAAMPVCPAGGEYTVDVIGKNPACSVPGHNMPGGQ